jgi:hypothetical protein
MVKDSSVAKTIPSGPRQLRIGLVEEKERKLKIEQWPSGTVQIGL